jgi:hypothetical protein
MLGPARVGVVGPPWLYWRHKLTQAVGANMTTAKVTQIKWLDYPLDWSRSSSQPRIPADAE